MAETSPGRIDLLITDVIMPGMNGREFSEQLSRRIPGLRVLFTSGYTADIIGHHGVLEPGVNFIRKPFSLEDLSSAVRKALES